MNADEAMQSYARLAQMHADNLHKLATSFSALYGTLSADQKKTADKLFRSERGSGAKSRTDFIDPGGVLCATEQTCIGSNS
ncbi:hypothetical protein QNM99_05835 [Pseudomonas sp. PCH446]